MRILIGRLTALIQTLLACLFAACTLLTAAAHAEGLDTWAPRYQTAPQTEAPATKAHSVYLGGVGGYAWLPDEAHEAGIEDSWNGGLMLGYLYRNGRLGAGVEADYVVRDLESGDLEDGMASVRARLGVFADNKTFLYGTAGIAEAVGDTVPDELSKGLVVGGGIERDVARNLAVRAEVLHYRHADRHVEWGELGSTSARVGMAVKF